MSKPSPLFVRSADSRAIEDLLASAKVGELVTYEAMDKAAGRDCRVFCRGAMASARRRLLRERGFVFGTVLDMGLRRLSDGEIVQAATKDTHGIRRASRRASERLATVDRAVLTPPERMRLDIDQARFAVIEMCSGHKGEKAIEHQVDQSKTTLAIAQALEALKKA